jgi:hypothetical protein
MELNLNFQNRGNIENQVEEFLRNGENNQLIQIENEHNNNPNPKNIEDFHEMVNRLNEDLLNIENRRRDDDEEFERIWMM